MLHLVGYILEYCAVCENLLVVLNEVEGHKREVSQTLLLYTTVSYYI